MKITATVVSSDTLIYAWIVDHDDWGRCFIVHQSIRVKDHQPLYEPVAKFLDENRHALVYEEQTSDETMMGYQRVVRVYKLED
ncbi:hypothetical protein [Nocardia acidivorans]|uniref:hypothetical protein n=1 Tax=Nocardia acidivorans TaxID=404580 RepID=UPI000836C49C|nr:hypothetical protein [Nocardia acidivorans]